MAKKKKKKEEFDAALMSGFLPGVAPVAAVPKLSNMPDFLKWQYRYPMFDLSGQRDTPFTAEQFLKAWVYYGVGGVADPKNFFEAAGWSKALGIPLVGGWVVAGVIGFFVTGLALTAVDPAHKWEGGLDETVGYQNFVSPLTPGSSAPSGGWWDWGRYEFDIGGMGSLT